MADTRDYGDYGDEWWTGMCKWFNRQSGWGFIVLTDSAGDYTGDEIFVHYNALKVPINNGGEPTVFRYLSAGEYVMLQIGRTDDVERPWQASTVKGIDGGPLLCQSKDVERSARTVNSTTEESTPQRGQPYRVSVAGKMNTPSPRGSGPRDRPRGGSRTQDQRGESSTKGWFVAE